MNDRIPSHMQALYDEMDRRQDARNAAQDVSAGRHVADAIKAIPQHAITPEIVAHWLSLISESVARSPWNCTNEGEIAQSVLDDLSDDLRSEA